MKKEKWIKILKIGAITLLGFLLLLLILPMFFQNKIAQRLLKESDRFLNAKVTMEHFHLSLLRTFPNPTLVLKGVTVENTGQFQGVKLLEVDDFVASVNVFSLFTDMYKIKKIMVNNPTVNLISTEEGANWDIVKSDEEKEADGETGHFSFKFDKIVLDNANVSFKDVPGDMYAKVKGFDFSLSGNLSQDYTTLRTSFYAPSADFKYNGVKYLSAAKLRLKAAVDADFTKSKYTIQDNEIAVNALVFSLQGWLSVLKDGFDMDIKLNLPKNDFKNIISLVPAIYAKNFDEIKTAGKVALTAFAKGKMQKDSYPAFNVQLKINDAMFHYPSLPTSVDKINIDAGVSSLGGDLDNVVVDVRQFHFVIADNPFDFTVRLSTPVSDPDVVATLKGLLDFSQIKNVYPLEEGKSMSGTFNMDLALAGKLSYVERGQYERFKASGMMSIENLLVQNRDVFQQNVAVTDALLKFTSEYADLQKFVAVLGKNDLSIMGKVENYIPYIFGEGILKGHLTVNSSHLNVNELLVEEDETTVEMEEDTSSATLFKVPDNLDLTANLQVGDLQYDNIKMKNATLLCVIKEAKLSVKRLAADLFSGSIAVDGSYSNPTYNKGLADLAVNVNNISTRNLCETFNLFGTFLPIFKNADGDITFTLNGNMMLDETMSPDYSSVNAEGMLGLNDVQFANIETLNKINDLLKVVDMKTVELKDMNVGYKLEDGKMKTKPFSFKLAKSTVDVESGTIGLDKSLQYVAVVTMPSAALGDATVSMAKSLAQKSKLKGWNAASADEIQFTVTIGGTFDKPTLSIGLEQAREKLEESVADATKQGKAAAKDVVDKALTEAQKKADELVAVAQKRADEMVEAQRKAGEKLIAAAKAEAEKSVAAAKNPLEKAAKQTAANLVIGEAEKKAARLNAETKTRADKLVANAKAEGDKLIASARNKREK